MRSCLFAALVGAVAPLAANAQNATDHPFKSAKTGDYATYLATYEVKGRDLSHTETITVTAASDKKVTVELTGKENGNPFPPRTESIDLTKEFHPHMLLFHVPPATPPKVEVTGRGSEKITVRGKTYETTWETSVTKFASPGGTFTVTKRTWVRKDTPFVLVKIETTSTRGPGDKVNKTSLELIDAGRKE